MSITFGTTRRMMIESFRSVLNKLLEMLGWNTNSTELQTSDSDWFFDLWEKDNNQPFWGEDK